MYRDNGKRAASKNKWIRSYLFATTIAILICVVIISTSTYYYRHHNLSYHSLADYQTNQLRYKQPSNKLSGKHHWRSCNHDWSDTTTDCTICNDNHGRRHSDTGYTLNQRKLWQQYVNNAPSYQSISNQYFISGSRGIVTSAGTYDDIDSLIALLYILRNILNCTLPIQIAHLSNEISIIDRSILTQYTGVTLLNLNDQTLYSPIATTESNDRKYYIKLFAVLNSKFEHVLWLDVDNVPIDDPEYLFDLPEYTDTTALFWRDMDNRVPSAHQLYSILDIPCIEQEPAQESGQLMINKRTAWKPLHLIQYMGMNWNIYTDGLLGDKELFHLSWMATHTPYFVIRRQWDAAGFMYKNTSFCGISMVQRDTNNQVVFIHVNAPKIFKQQFIDEHIRPSDLFTTWQVWSTDSIDVLYLWRQPCGSRFQSNIIPFDQMVLPNSVQQLLQTYVAHAYRSWGITKV